MEQNQDLGPADVYSKPQREYQSELDGEDMEDASSGTSESKEQQGKSSPNLLLMLKAAEKRRTQQGRDRDGLQISEVGARRRLTEALKTNMVSRDSASLC